jgi:CubicO group peptidase (beta-lactamase class C family)
MIRTHMPLKSALATLLLATPLHAQDAGPTDRILEGLVACYTGTGDTNATVTVLKSQGWVQSDAEEGMIYLSAPDDTTFVYMDASGYFCDTESTTIDSATASEVLATMLQSADVTAIEYNKTPEGCTQLGLPDRTTATITSGGNDPTCGSDTDSAIRFEFASE